MSEPVLTLTGICKSYNPGQANEVRVLQSCDLTLMPWQVTSLVAPSGSGKSTLLHIAGSAGQCRQWSVADFWTGHDTR